MVHLGRIYTRTGDDGSTGLGDGTRTPKHDLRVAAYGTVDELSSVIGVALAQGVEERFGALLRSVQNDLFDVGADLCVPGESGDGLRIGASYVERLEVWIDEHNASLQPLSSFILPGGAPGAAWMHLARTVCRRAERMVTALMDRDEELTPVNAHLLRYLNRLSDLLFVLARVSNDDGNDDVLWEPGGAHRGAADEGGREQRGIGRA